MALEVIEKLIDDLDGGEAVETVSFGLDGTAYEIDLSKRNAAAFREALQRYVNAGRKITSTQRARAKRAETPPARKGWSQAGLRYRAASRVGRGPTTWRFPHEAASRSPSSTSTRRRAVDNDRHPRRRT